MATLVDTNILLRSLNPDDPQYDAAAKALAKIRASNEVLCIMPQILIEFWAVATRPSNKNGLGLTISEAESELTTIRRFFRLLPCTPAVLEIWQRMVVLHRVSGKQTHDAHVAAIMRVHGVTDILTFNVADFERFPGVTILHPAKL